MSARVLGLAVGVALSSGCALVSGLSSLEVTDGSVPADAAAEQLDVLTLPEAEAGPIEAGAAGYALMAAGGCATSGVPLSLSNLEFTLAFWLRVDAQTQDVSQVLPIIWNGGRGASEPGWSFNLTDLGVELCVADQNGSTCSTKWPITEKHLVHFVVTSPYNGQTSGRSINVYAHDLSDPTSTTHTLVGSATGAQGNWSTSAPFTIGGAMVGTSCTSPANVTVDRVQIVTTVVPTSLMDATEKSSVCSLANSVAADYEFDEASGTQAKDCSPAQHALSLGSATSFVVSPFE